MTKVDRISPRFSGDFLTKTGINGQEVPKSYALLILATVGAIHSRTTHHTHGYYCRSLISDQQEKGEGFKANRGRDIIFQKRYSDTLLIQHQHI